MANEERRDNAGSETDSSEEMNDYTTGCADPDFQYFYPADHTEMRAKNFEVFVSANLKDIQNAKENQGAFRQGIAASFVFNVAERCNLSDQAAFMALELLDRFMMKHIEVLYQTVQSVQRSDQQKHEDWMRKVEQMESQVHLRAVSCCQLASKFHSRQEAMQISVAKQILDDLDYRYSEDAIRNSEQHILGTLNYNVAFKAPYDYVLVILEMLDCNMVGVYLPVSNYLTLSTKFLTLLYSKCDMIYKLVLQETKPSYTRMTLKTVQADKLLMAVSVIATSAYISDPHNALSVREELIKLSGVPERDVLVFMDVLLMLIRYG